MTRLEAAHRLGVAEHQILALEEHPAGHLATLRSGVVMLVSETTARVYLPEVDDPADESLAAENARDREVLLQNLPYSVAAPAAQKPKSAAKKKSAGGTGS